MEENVQQSQFIILAKKVWPPIHRALTTALYFLYNLIRNAVITAIEQIKNV